MSELEMFQIAINLVVVPIVWQLWKMNTKMDKLLDKQASMQKQFDRHDQELHDHIYVKRDDQHSGDKND